MSDSEDQAIRSLYHRVLAGWNNASGDEFAAPFAEDGEIVGFDGSQSAGRGNIAAEMGRIFADHATGAYVGKVRGVRRLGPRAAVLRAVCGMVPAGCSDLEPKLNAVQTVVAEKIDDEWRVVLYQNTPARFHGRRDLAESLTEELRHELKTRF
jgi:uncharacterized protein (TIGR02246 family)